MNPYINQFLYYFILIFAYLVVGYGLVVAARKIFRHEKRKEERLLSENVDKYFKEADCSRGNLDLRA